MENIQWLCTPHALRLSIVNPKHVLKHSDEDDPTHNILYSIANAYELFSADDIVCLTFHIPKETMEALYNIRQSVKQSDKTKLSLVECNIYPVDMSLEMNSSDADTDCDDLSGYELKIAMVGSCIYLELFEEDLGENENWHSYVQVEAAFEDYFNKYIKH